MYSKLRKDKVINTHGGGGNERELLQSTIESK